MQLSQPSCVIGPRRFKSMADTKDTRVDLAHADLRGLPPGTIVNAELDPLQSDGVTPASVLRLAGAPVEKRTFSGVTHEFFGMGGNEGRLRRRGLCGGAAEKPTWRQVNKVASHSLRGTTIAMRSELV